MANKVRAAGFAAIFAGLVFGLALSWSAPMNGGVLLALLLVATGIALVWLSGVAY